MGWRKIPRLAIVQPEPVSLCIAMTESDLATAQIARKQVSNTEIYHQISRPQIIVSQPSKAIVSPWCKSLLQKWNESGFRPPLCTYRLNWASRTSWGWWDEWDDTVLRTHDLKFQPWRSEAEHATSRSRGLPTMSFTRGWGRNFFCFFQTAETGNRTPNSGVKGSGANH